MTPSASYVILGESSSVPRGYRFSSPTGASDPGSVPRPLQVRRTSGCLGLPSVTGKTNKGNKGSANVWLFGTPERY
ncbi:hypothetical protein NDU88_001458 [Pleurodeles waltl]|uniref:Uncharacterized protein n=1 Tax=Pleurodeles waltl TaxID=8319 RepID=A0AAV7P410_PLEWA|nr:hypothetical protein NDU88_001458 [Pleurodeles waltl]